ncbi:MAG TPA: cation:dicarboxylase symporter family transporter, partial [Tenuifilaceae bacterium]|nr:cation:dicarboxylase symporter family transporter [Tenuifilaceae bacterium]
MLKKLPLYSKILLGMLFGFIVGVVAVLLGANQLVSDYIKPFGTIFLNLLKLVAMPLIFASLVAGVAGLSDITKLS